MFILVKGQLIKRVVIRINYESQNYAKAKGLMSLVLPVIPNVFFQEVFSDFCDGSGFLPKSRVGDAVRCLGENPLQSEVTQAS